MLLTLLSAAAVASLQVELLQGTTVIATRSVSPTGTTTSSALTLTTEERDAITDWTALRVRLTKSGAQLDVFEVSLATPAAATVTGTAAAAAATPSTSVSGSPVGTGTVALAADVPTTSATGTPVGTGTVSLSASTPTVSATGAATATLLVELLEGATTRASWTVYPASATTSSLTLTTGERNAISDWTALRVRVTKSGAQIDVLDVSLQTPAAESGATGTVAIAAATPTTSASGTPVSTGTVAIAADTPTTSVTGTPVATGTTALAADTPSTSVAGTPVVTGTAAAAASTPTVEAVNSSTASLFVELLEGATVRASWTVSPATVTSSALTLSTPERDSITDWTALRVRLTKSGAQVDVLDVSLQTPAGIVTGTVAASVSTPTVAATNVTPTGTVAIAAATPTVAATGPDNPLLLVELLEGATVRASRYTLVAATATTDTFTLTTDERDSITDWTALRVRVTQTIGQVRIFDVELEAPDAAAGSVTGTVAISAATPTTSVAGTPAVTGTVAAAGSTPTASATDGIGPLEGTVAAAAATPTTSVAGTPVLTGAVVLSSDAPTVAASGTPTITGTAAGAAAQALASVLGTPVLVGSVAASVGTPTVAALEVPPVVPDVLVVGTITQRELATIGTITVVEGVTLGRITQAGQAA